MMKLIKRNFYLDKLINTMNMPDIKVITEVRCAGKSKLLDKVQMCDGFEKAINKFPAEEK